MKFSNSRKNLLQISALLILAFSTIIVFLPRKPSDQEELRFGWDLSRIYLSEALETDRALGCLILTASWLLMSALLVFLFSGKRENRRFNPLLALWSSFGLGIFAILVGNALTPLDSKLTVLIATLVFYSTAVLIFSINFRVEKASQPRPRRLTPSFLIFAAGIILISIKLLLPLFFWVVVKKPPATWDELSFWWTASSQIAGVGFSKYLSSHALANYDPGFPILAQILTVVSFRQGFEASSPAIGFVLGLLSLVYLGNPLSSIPRKYRWKVGCLFIALFYGLILAQPWMLSLWFQYLNGDALAALAIFGLFLSVDPGQFPEIRSGTIRRMALYLQCVGVGMIARLIKPPFSSIGFPLLLAWLIYEISLIGFGAKKANRKFRIFRLFAITGGFIAAQVLWKINLNLAGRAIFYQVPTDAITRFDFSYLTHTLMPFWLTGSRILMLSAAALTSVFLLVLSKRFLPQVALAWALIAAVAGLYCTIWTKTEIVSSARYISQSALALVFYSVMVGGPSLFRVAQSLLNRLKLQLGKT